jgi:DNA replication protein DnaC
MITHPLLPKLRQLRLSGILNSLELRTEQAVSEQLAPTQFLALLLDDELERRSQKRMAQQLCKSGCDPQKNLAYFDFSAQPGINRSLITDLATCTFISRHENILLCGPTGVGKSHLANALAIEAIKRDLKVFSGSIHRMLMDVHGARASSPQPFLMSRILACDLLVLDDFGLQSLTPSAIQDLYEIITERYERGSIILTSNRAFEEWHEVFGNPLLASAALDRLTHHAHFIVITGESYRQKNRRKEALSQLQSSIQHA